jgi:hypothetical protein
MGPDLSHSYGAYNFKVAPDFWKMCMPLFYNVIEFVTAMTLSD